MLGLGILSAAPRGYSRLKVKFTTLRAKNNKTLGEVRKRIIRDFM